MPSHLTTSNPTMKRNWNVEDDTDTLRFALRIMLDFHGPAAVVTYAKDHRIPCAACPACGWVPHIDGDCLICEMPELQGQ